VRRAKHVRRRRRGRARARPASSSPARFGRPLVEPWARPGSAGQAPGGADSRGWSRREASRRRRKSTCTPRTPAPAYPGLARNAGPRRGLPDERPQGADEGASRRFANGHAASDVPSVSPPPVPRGNGLGARDAGLAANLSPCIQANPEPRPESPADPRWLPLTVPRGGCTLIPDGRRPCGPVDCNASGARARGSCASLEHHPIRSAPRPRSRSTSRAGARVVAPARARSHVARRPAARAVD
jgi:hypothetical protein